jgi:hypothetical protein
MATGTLLIYLSCSVQSGTFKRECHILKVYTLIREDEKVRVMEIIAQLMIMTLGDHRYFLALILQLLSHEDKRGHRAQCSSFLMNIARGDKSCFHNIFMK